MASISITFNNYSNIELTLQKPNPVTGWSTDGGISVPTAGTAYATDSGDTFGMDVQNPIGFSGYISFVGPYGNIWKLLFGWDKNGSPSCSLTPAPGGKYVSTDGSENGVTANLSDPMNPIYSWDFIATTASASQAHSAALIKAQGAAQSQAKH